MSMPNHLLNVEEDIPRLVSHPEETPYAILSHRWGNDEVLYEDIVGGFIQVSCSKQVGYDKIIGACGQAKRDGHTHIWIDSCCIDQRSSTALSEDINSMYRYNATMCYAYLAGLPNNPFDAHFGPSFANHEWFERGWTLQELIAPKEVKFFTDLDLGGNRDTKRWYYLGRKTEMCDSLSRTTGIDPSILSHERHVRQASVAKRMSWAAKRKTRKIEDRAYCMMGLFDVNMPMLYGEGEKAFIRLQEEIMKDSSDESLFAWRNGNAHPNDHVGLLATSPAMFADSGQIVGYYDWEPRVPFYKTNFGLQITLHIRLVEKNLYLATLNCTRPQGSGGFAALYLKKLDNRSGTGDQQYARVQSGKILGLNNANERGNTTTIYVRQTVGLPGALPIFPEHIVQLRLGPNPALKYKLHGTMGIVSKNPLALNNWSWVPRGLNSAFRVILEKNKLSAVAVFARPDGSKFTVLLGSSSDIGQVAAEVIDGCEENRTFGDWAQIFQPQALGSLVDLGNDLVRIDIELRIVHGYKYYLVNIHVEEPPTMVDDMIDMFNETSLRVTLDVLPPEISGMIPDTRKVTAATGRKDRLAGFKRVFKH
ncbi:heterokaryon incompatibility protein-domain-containing protein [Hypoxylon sp. NC1633]|nr:heterokaryon incompatibility protein-domain-containing protein [Hypoxylon sp. NC1633]